MSGISILIATQTKAACQIDIARTRTRGAGEVAENSLLVIPKG